MTLTQLRAFVLVARLGSVQEAAHALAVSEPAVSQALAALRRHLGDPLLVRGQDGMTLTEAGARLLPIAAQILTLEAEAQSSIHAPQTLRVIATPALAEYVATPLLDAFVGRSAAKLDANASTVTTREIPGLLHNRLADIALGPCLNDDPTLRSTPIFRTTLVALGVGPHAPHTTWLVDPSGTDPRSETAALLRRLKISEEHIRVHPTQTSACSAAAEGNGVAIAVSHLHRGGLATAITTPATPLPITWHATTLADHGHRLAGAFRRYLTTPDALHIMRNPTSGVPPSRFRPPVHVTIWS
ncbi:LysR family transcriptional regulator [Spirillospora sp. NPDC047279]|uniref:LysR family transcriptional regulator n=1 Tax=Spirillospora sp. NPDC047279 TaxID=3155478 RepID=UPI0033F08BD6